MKFLVLVVSLAIAVSARPDVSELSSGYNYNQPGGQTNFGSSSGLSGSYLPGSGGGGSNILGSSIFGGGQSGFNGGGINGGYNPNLVQDQKHVYFYAAPDDEAPARLRINVGSNSQKNTKIIFIKAPSAGGLIPEVIAPPSQAEDKTLVYVLVKKQDHPGPINIPASHSVKQAKPEVFFIKYNNQHDAQQAVSGGLSGQAVGSHLDDLGNQESFVRTIKDTPSGHGFGGLGGGDISGGSSILGSVSGGSQGSFGSFDSGSGSGGIGVSSNYGTPGASGPY